MNSTKTISVASTYHQYSDYNHPKEIPALELNGVLFVGMIVHPRGFANERISYVIRADDKPALAALIAKTERMYNKPVGDGYTANWLTPEKTRRAYFGHRGCFSPID